MRYVRRVDLFTIIVITCFGLVHVYWPSLFTDFVLWKQYGQALGLSCVYTRANLLRAKYIPGYFSSGQIRVASTLHALTMTLRTLAEIKKNTFATRKRYGVSTSWIRQTTLTVIMRPNILLPLPSLPPPSLSLSQIDNKYYSNRLLAIQLWPVLKSGFI